MEKNKIDFAAGVVLFNPDINRLKLNLDAICNQVKTVYLVDNGSSNICDIQELLRHYTNISVQFLNDNMGISYALNRLVDRAANNGFKWILTLDQDSVCKRNLIREYATFLKNNQENYIGCVTCNIVDRNYTRKESYHSSNFKSINYCITSGSLMNISALTNLGGFDEKMFIDKVDTEICIRLLTNKYKIIRINYDGLLHEIGHAKQINLGYRKWELYNHQPIRRYYMVRNAVYLFKKYHRIYTLKLLVGEIFQSVLVLLFEDKKNNKLIMELQGFKDGLIGNYGKYKGNIK